MGIILIGSLNLDLVVRVPRFPDKGETLIGQDYKSHPGGKGLNQAVAISRCGSKVKMVGLLGDDIHADIMQNILEDEKVDCTHVMKLNGSSGTAFIEVDDLGNNRIIVIPGANGKLGKEHINSSIFETSCGRKILIASLENPVKPIEFAFDLSTKQEYFTILNPAPAKPLSTKFYNSIDLFIPNQNEAEFYTGLKVKNFNDAELAAKKILELGVKSTIITLGEQGAIYVDSHLTIRQKAFKIKSIDSTGAGDAFCGAIASQLFSEESIGDALRFACAAGALATAKQGAVPSLPSRRSILALLKSQPNN